MRKIIGFIGIWLFLITPVFAEIEVGVEGLIEVGYEKVGDESGNLSAGDIEISIDAKLNEEVSAHILLRPDTPEEILDEATISLEGFSKALLSITAGKCVMPFGVFESHLISDPWTKENSLLTWEINKVGIIGSYHKESLEFSLALYDSSSEEEPAALAAQVSAVPVEGLTLGASYRNQKGDEEGTDVLADLSVMAQYAPGLMTIDLEYCLASDRENGEPKPSAYAVSLAYQVNEPLKLALRYDGLSDDDDTTISPESRIGIGINYALFEVATLSVEYGSIESEEGDRESSYAAKLAVEF